MRSQCKAICFISHLAMTVFDIACLVTVLVTQYQNISLVNVLHISYGLAACPHLRLYVRELLSNYFIAATML